MVETLRRDDERTKRYGHVRPIIHADVAGQKIVAVGSEIHWSPEWKTFPDFLSHYIKLKLGPEWGTAELQKPPEEQHPLLQLYRRSAVAWNSPERDEQGIFSTIPSGPMLAWLALGYDLYVVRHHQALEQRLLRRLQHERQFQGARHELFVAATFIRAGFSIDFTDETDGSQRHPEFLAIHRRTGQKVAVEAKSRHRPGVLGYPGLLDPTRELKAGIQGLLEDAFGKPTDQPYVVCVDVNLPPNDKPIRDLPWFQEILETLSDHERAFPDELDRYTQITFTNQPLHYGDDRGRAPRCDAVTVLAKRPGVPFEDYALPAAIQEAATQFGNIPNWFEDGQAFRDTDVED